MRGRPIASIAPHRTRLLLGVAPVCVVAIGVLGAIGRRTLHRVKVSGPSMLPALKDGDRLLVRRTGDLRPGDVVVLHDPDEPARLVVKRAASVGEETVWVLGDNASMSRDSRTYGPVKRELVVGRAWWRYFPSERSGRILPGGPAADEG